MANYTEHQIKQLKNAMTLLNINGIHSASPEILVMLCEDLEAAYAEITKLATVRRSEVIETLQAEVGAAYKERLETIEWELKATLDQKGALAEELADLAIRHDGITATLAQTREEAEMWKKECKELKNKDRVHGIRHGQMMEILLAFSRR